MSARRLARAVSVHDGALRAGHRRLASVSFSKCTGLAGEVSVEEYAEGGENRFSHRFPSRASYPNLVLTQGAGPTQELWDWFYEFHVTGLVAPRDGTVSLMSVSTATCNRCGSGPSPAAGRQSFPARTWTPSPVRSPSRPSRSPTTGCSSRQGEPDMAVVIGQIVTETALSQPRGNQPGPSVGQRGRRSDRPHREARNRARAGDLAADCTERVARSR